MTYAHEEADAAERLAVLAHSVANWLPRAVGVIEKHARDESQHVLYFLELLDCVFPRLDYDRRSRQKLESRRSTILKPARDRQLSADQLTAEVARINIGEVKNRVHLSLMRTWALRHSSIQNRLLVDQITANLLRDELNHVVYTGLVLQMIERTHLVPNIAEIYCHGRGSSRIRVEHIETASIVANNRRFRQFEARKVKVEA